LKSTTDTWHQRTLIPYLLIKSGGDLELTLSFAEQFHIENDFVYSQCVLQELVIHSISERDPTLRFARIESMIASIANKELFVQFLMKQCLNKLSPYDYEALLFVNQEILKLSPECIQTKKNVLVLEMLMNYTRLSPPLDEESTNNTDPDHDIGLANIEKSWVTSWSKV
jgi:hypothetical protein